MPFVHRYGRRPIYLVSTFIQFATTIWYANMKSKNEFFALTFISSLGGAVSEAIAVVTISDLFYVHQRGRLNGVYLATQATGTSLGPVIMGYVVKDLGWRFMWWLSAILVGTNSFLVLFFFEESKYVTPLISGRALNHDSGKEVPLHTIDGQDESDQESSKSSSKPRPFAKCAPETSAREETDIIEDTSQVYKRKPYRQRLALATPTDEPILRHFYRPFLILVSIPGAAYVAITYGSLLAWSAVVSSSQSYFTVVPPYNLSPVGVGLLALGPFVGQLVGSILISPLNDLSAIKLARRNGGIFEPEMRLWLAIPGALVCFAGLMTYGMCLSSVSTSDMCMLVFCELLTSYATILVQTTDDVYRGFRNLQCWIHRLR